MAREILKGLGKSGNLKINGYGRRSSENLFILFKRERIYCIYPAIRRGFCSSRMISNN